MFTRDDLHSLFLGVLDTVKPKAAFSALFREVLLNVWRQKQQAHAETKVAAKKRGNELEQRKQKLIDALLDGKIPQEIYDDQIVRVGTALDELAAIESESLLSESELQRLVDFADWLLTNSPSVWHGASI